MGELVSKELHEEFEKRMNEENTRQNRRIKILEDQFKEIHTLSMATERMAANMENMMKELKKQGDRLEKLEREPAEVYKQIKMSVVTTLIGAIVGAAVTAVMMIL